MTFNYTCGKILACVLVDISKNCFWTTCLCRSVICALLCPLSTYRFNICSNGCVHSCDNIELLRDLAVDWSASQPMRSHHRQITRVKQNLVLRYLCFQTYCPVVTPTAMFNCSPVFSYSQSLQLVGPELGDRRDLAVSH